MSALDAALAEAALLDASDPLRSLRASFLLPQHRGTDAVYLCGHSLGAQPRAVQEHVARQLDKWGAQAVEGHFSEPTPWLTMDDTVQASMARVVGSKPSEVVLMNSLTCNLHLMMAAFYAPSQRRVKILIEKKAFPSDVHAVVSQIRHHKLDPVDALVELEPRTGETHLRAEDIEQCIAALGDSLALVMFAGVQYFTGQVFPLARITAAAHAVGALAGFDLAHAVGNVPLALHDWECDFACWCTYKYLNCGPGGIGGCFVHERHSLTRDSRPHLAGWWGHRLSDRFDMGPAFEPCEGAYGYRLSNPPVLLLACARASLDLFDQAGMDAIRAKSLLLTGLLERLLTSEVSADVQVFSPSDPSQRGCQLSLRFLRCDVERVSAALATRGVICDVRKPSVMRVAPAPLYNSFQDVVRFVAALKLVLGELART